MGRWGHDRDDDSDGKPLKHLVLAAKEKARVRIKPKPRHQPDDASKRENETERPSRSYVEPSATSVKDGIRELVLDDPNMPPDDIARKIKRSHGFSPSTVTVSMIRTEFKATLKFLDARGHLKGLTLKKGDGATKRR